MSGIKKVTNTTLTTISLLEVGKDLAAGEVYNIAPQYFPLWAYAARSGSALESLILSGDITVSDNLSPSLDATLGLGLLRNTLARDILFDNRTNDFTSTQVQAAIEEARNSGTYVTLDCDPALTTPSLVIASSSVDDKAVQITNNTYTGLVIGVAISKPTTTTCKVLLIGRVSGFSGLVRNKPVYVSTSGTPTTTVPTGPLQAIGTAISSTDFILNVASTRVMR